MKSFITRRYKIVYISYIILLLIIYSCNRKQSQVIIQQNPYIDPIISNVINFDSTYYFLLRNGYAKKDTMMINNFFEKWSEASSKLRNSNEDRIAKLINDIFVEIYYPFNLEKYGWIAWENKLQNYKYAILPSTIKYEITDAIYDTKFLKQDTLCHFYPMPSIGKAKRLVDIDPFKKSMELFLSEDDSFDKLFFLDTCKYIHTPISPRWDAYQTTPKIYYIKINKKLNHAVVHLRLISTVLAIEVTCKQDRWSITRIEELWEE